jgi:hypothetical protein
VIFPQIPLLSSVAGQLRVPELGIMLERLERANQTMDDPGERVMVASIRSLTYDKKAFLLPLYLGISDIPAAANTIQDLTHGKENVTIRARMDPSVNLLSALFADVQLFQETISPDAGAVMEDAADTTAGAAAGAKARGGLKRSKLEINVTSTATRVDVGAVVRFPFSGVGFDVRLAQTTCEVTNRDGEALAKVIVGPIHVGETTGQIPIRVVGTVANRRPFAVTGRRLVTDRGRADIGVHSNAAATATVAAAPGAASATSDAGVPFVVHSNFSLKLSSFLEAFSSTSSSSSSSSSSASSSASSAGGEPITPAFTNHGIQFVGGEREGSDMYIPCLIPGLCPDVLPASDKANATFQLLGNVSVHFPLMDIDVDVTEPLWIQADCCVHEPLASLRVAPFRLSSAAPSTLIALSVVLTDPQEIKTAIGGLIDSYENTTFRIHGQQDQDLLSAMFSEIEVLLEVPATNPLEADDTIPSSSSSSKSITDQWYLPLNSVGAWSLTGTDAHQARFDVKMQLPNPAPWDLLFPDAEISMLHANRRVGLVVPMLPDGTTSSLRLVASTKNNVTAKLTLMDEDPISPECAKRTDQGAYKSMCNLADVVKNFIARYPMEVTWELVFTNMLGNSVRGSMNTLFFADTHALKPAPRAEDAVAANAPDATSDFSNLISGVKVDYADTAWQTMITSGVTAKISIGITNVFAFPLEISSYVVDFKYQDPTGEYIPYLPKNYAPKADIFALRGVGDSGFTLAIAPGLTGYSPKKAINVKDNLVEHGCRIYNQAAVQKQWCASVVNGFLGLAIRHPSDTTPGFRFTQPLDVPDISILGDFDCTCWWCACVFCCTCTCIDHALLSRSPNPLVVLLRSL